jgi:coenzyme PQQ precursor peptide PqqA
LWVAEWRWPAGSRSSRRSNRFIRFLVFDSIRPLMVSASPRKPWLQFKELPVAIERLLAANGDDRLHRPGNRAKKRPSQAYTIRRGELCGCLGIARGLGGPAFPPLPPPPSSRPRLSCAAGVSVFLGLARHAALRPAVEPVPFVVDRHLSRRRNTMNWTTPTLVEICIGLEINGYLPAEF